MWRSPEQNIAIELYVKLDKSTVKTFPTIKTAFGNGYLLKRVESTGFF